MQMIVVCCHAGELERSTAGEFIQGGGAKCRTIMLSEVALATMQARQWTVQRTSKLNPLFCVSLQPGVATRVPHPERELMSKITETGYFIN